MKKYVSAMLVIALMLCGFAALAEGTQDAAGLEVNTLTEDGSFIIQIGAGDDLGWIADDMAQDDSVVKLAFEDTLEGTYVARYEPTGDGDVTVGVRHYIGIACDKRLTWDLRVADGAVQEVTGGSQAFSPDEAEQDPLLSGEWLQAETQFTQMTVQKNEARGWDVEIAAPMTHGAYIFKTTIYYDCDVNGFVYDKGKFWDLPITDSDEAVELGEAKLAGTTGVFAFSEDDQEVYLSWYDDHDPEADIVVFERAADAAEEAVSAD